jgi:hypothetical protein
MRKAFVVALCTLALALGLSTAASAAGCTATASCNDACSLSFTCPSPYPPCELSCTAFSRSVSCTGTTTCNVGTGAVTCDGVTTSCPGTSQCYWSGFYSITCGSRTRTCTYNCPV